MANKQTLHLNHVSLKALRAVESVARLGTVRAAADELNVTPGAISQQIIKAEAQLDHVLFDRIPVGLVPTRMGRQVAAALTEGFDNLEKAVALTKPRSDTLTVSVAPVFASRWLVPRLPSLEARSKGLRVNVDATAKYVEPGRSGVDACLRVANKETISGLKSELSAIFLADQHVFPVCTPGMAQYLERITDLASVPIIIDGNTTLDWDLWLDPLGGSKNELCEGTTYSDASLCIDAAIAGGGVFLAWDMLAVDAISRRELVRPFKETALSGLSYWLVRQRRSRLANRLKQLEDWLKDAIDTSLAAGPSNREHRAR